jgi:diguanylate cyclase (GGDEF)-like protein
MADIKQIAIQTIKNLNEKNIDPTPENYMKEFCNINSHNNDCEFFTKSLLELSQDELDHYKADKIQSVYDIVKILLKRPSSKDLSIHTGEVGNIIKNMDSQLQDSIKSHYNAFMNIQNIKKDIQSSNTNDEIKIVKTKLIDATSSLENEIETVNKKLTNEKQQIEILEEKIKTLEDSLNTYKKESSIDFLTTLLTRKAYEKEVEKFEERFTRDNIDYAVVFFDLDKFKAVNDNYGHDCGDTVLKTFGLILNKLTRKTDVVARYGGEEFVALIQYKKEEDLLKYLKRVKDVVTSNKFTHKDLKLDITFSAGVDIRSRHNSYEDTIQQADILLYEAKFDGRNRIILASGTVIK